MTLPEGFKAVHPRGDRILVKAAPAEVKTRGGILLPTSAQRKPTSGDVVAVGDGRTSDGNTKPFYLKPGDTVLYSKFGFMYTDVKVGEEDFILIKEDDVIGIMPKTGADAEDIPEMKPLGDRCLVLVEDTADITLGGVVLPDAAKERPLLGTVVTVGPGKYNKDAEGGRKKMMMKSGDKVLYFKYGGENMETPAGVKYVVLKEDDILCKAVAPEDPAPAAAEAARAEAEPVVAASE